MNDEKELDPAAKQDPQSLSDQEKKIKVAKQLMQNVCICKGIKLATILRAAKTCHTVEEVNNEVGSGSGGCHGERCGPKIKALLERVHPKEG